MNILKIKKIDSKDHANKITAQYIRNCNLTQRVFDEELRYMIDDLNIVKESGSISVEVYFKTNFPVDWEKSTIYTKLSVARMLHDFKIEGIVIPSCVNYTTCKTLTYAFCKFDIEEQRRLQIVTWNRASSLHDKPTTKDVKDAIEYVEEKVVVVDSLKDSIERTTEAVDNTLEIANQYLEALPDVIQDVLVDVFECDRYDNEFLKSDLSILDDCIRDEMTIEDIFKLMKERNKCLSVYFKTLRKFNANEYEEIISNTFKFDNRYHSIKLDKNIISSMKRRLAKIESKLN